MKWTTTMSAMTGPFLWKTIKVDTEHCWVDQGNNCLLLSVRTAAQTHWVMYRRNFFAHIFFVNKYCVSFVCLCCVCFAYFDGTCVKGWSHWSRMWKATWCEGLYEAASNGYNSQSSSTSQFDMYVSASAPTGNRDYLWVSRRQEAVSTAITIHTRIVTASTFLLALVTIDGSVVASNRCCDVCVWMERRTKHQLCLYVTLYEKTRLKSEEIQTEISAYPESW